MEGTVCIHTVVPCTLGTSLSKPVQHLPSLLIKLRGAEGTGWIPVGWGAAWWYRGDCRGWLWNRATEILPDRKGKDRKLIVVPKAHLLTRTLSGVWQMFKLLTLIKFVCATGTGHWNPQLSFVVSYWWFSPPVETIEENIPEYCTVCAMEPPCSSACLLLHSEFETATWNGCLHNWKTAAV